MDIGQYPGGVALWGAVPPIYDTTNMPLDKGIHVHARKRRGGKKVIDETFRQVTVAHQNERHVISELDAIYYMVSSIFGFGTKLIHCTRCNYPHLDKDWFSVHPHKSHLCAGCGKNFRDNTVAVGNPVALLQELPFAKKPKVLRAKEKLSINQKDFPGGIQIWSSNPSILWTADKHQESGVHIHAFRKDSEVPEVDDTYRSVEIDGIKLDENQVRTYMAQLSLPHLSGRVKAVMCPSCDAVTFDEKGEAFNLRVDRACNECGHNFKATGRLKKVVSNPILHTLEELSRYAVRELQIHDLGLLPETL